MRRQEAVRVARLVEAKHDVGQQLQEPPSVAIVCVDRQPSGAARRHVENAELRERRARSPWHSSTVAMASSRYGRLGRIGTKQARLRCIQGLSP